MDSTTTSAPLPPGGNIRRGDTGVPSRGADGGWSLAVVTVLAVLTAAGFGFGCGYEEAQPDPEAPFNDQPDQQMDGIQQAEQHLKDHRVDEARSTYYEMLEQDPGDGTAAAGAAVTDLLLLFEMDEVSELLIEYFEAKGSVDANALWYADGGILSWASRGARWTEQGDDFEGIRGLVAEELPFDEQRLESPGAFVDGLDDPFGQTLRQLVAVANAFSSIESHIETAIGDGDFVRLYIPGETFHNPALALQVGRSELATIQSVISLARSAVFFVAAYEHDWTLEDAFGSWRYGPPEDRYVPEYQPVDYTVDYLDAHLLRRLDAPERLSAARTNLRDAIRHLRDAIRFGLEEQANTTLQWQQISEDDASQLDELLEALEASLDGPVELPHVHPEMTLDLSPFFETEGRTLPEDVPWMIPDDELSAEADTEWLETDRLDSWRLNEQAIRVFFFEDVFEPIPDPARIDVQVGEDNRLDTLVDAVVGEYLEALEDTYFTTR